MKDKARMCALLIAVIATVGCNKGKQGNERETPSPSEPTLSSAVLNAGANPSDKRIQSFVSWLQTNGVQLELLDKESAAGEWKLAKPSTPTQYDITFYLRSFPEDVTEKQMQTAVRETNLAYILNARARLAMSYGGTTAGTPEQHPATDDDLPKLNGKPVTLAVQELFKAYKASE